MLDDHNFELLRYMGVFLEKLRQHNSREEKIIRLSLLSNYRTKEIALRLHITPSRVCHIRKRGMKRLGVIIEQWDGHQIDDRPISD